MIYLTIVFALMLFALSFLIYDLSNKIVKEREHFDDERQILLNRIENPKYQPPLSVGEKQANVDELNRLREEAEALGLVGQIVE